MTWVDTIFVRLSVSPWDYKGNQLLSHTVNHAFAIQSLIHGSLVFNAGDSQRRAAWISAIEEGLTLKLAMEVISDQRRKSEVSGKKGS